MEPCIKAQLLPICSCWLIVFSVLAIYASLRSFAIYLRVIFCRQNSCFCCSLFAYTRKYPQHHDTRETGRVRSIRPLAHKFYCSTFFLGPESMKTRGFPLKPVTFTLLKSTQKRLVSLTTSDPLPLFQDSHTCFILLALWKHKRIDVEL